MPGFSGARARCWSSAVWSHADVSAATLYQQATILVHFARRGACRRRTVCRQDTAAGNLGFRLHRSCGRLSRPHFVRQNRRSNRRVAGAVAQQFVALDHRAARGAVLGEPLTLVVLVGVLLIISGVFFVDGNRQPRRSGASRNKLLTLTSVMATVCYGIVPVLKKFGTDNGGHAGAGRTGHACHRADAARDAWEVCSKSSLNRERIAANSVVCFVAAGFLYAIGSILTLKALIYAPASVAAPVWSAQPIVSFFLGKTTLKGIEAVSWRMVWRRCWWCLGCWCCGLHKPFKSFKPFQ